MIELEFPQAFHGIEGADEMAPRRAVCTATTVTFSGWPGADGLQSIPVTPSCHNFGCCGPKAASNCQNRLAPCPHSTLEAD